MDATVETVEDQTLKDFFAKVEACETTEEKLRTTLGFMRETISEEGSPRFRHFWEARKLCVPLFKEGVHPAIRAQLWEEFTDLSTTARALKEHLDKASAFSSEQFELAITALEEEVARRDEKLTEVPRLTLPLPSEVLAKRLDAYDGAQRELNLLNGWATRLNALRKELVDTPMRLRDKNRLFKRLSALGEEIFPRRRELIEKVSSEFVDDVDRFISQAFAGSEPQQPPFKLRDEIKALQAFAKQMTLGTRAFASTRERLSECWNQLRESDKEHKKEQAEKRSAFKEQLDGLKAKVEELLQLETEPASRALDQLGKEIRTWDIGPREQRQVRDLTGKARQELFGRVKAEKEARAAASTTKMEVLRERVQLLLVADLSPKVLVEQRDALTEEITQAELLAGHRKALREEMVPLQERLLELEEADLLGTPEGRAEVARRREARRVEVKARVSELKGLKGKSGSNIEQALLYDRQLRDEKEKLERLEAAIAELKR